MESMRSVFEMEEQVPLEPLNVQVLRHLRNPQNLLTYLIFSAWMKFMGVASAIPSITLG